MDAVSEPPEVAAGEPFEVTVTQTPVWVVACARDLRCDRARRTCAIRTPGCSGCRRSIAPAEAGEVTLWVVLDDELGGAVVWTATTTVR